MTSGERSRIYSKIENELESLIVAAGQTQQDHVVHTLQDVRRAWDDFMRSGDERRGREAALAREISRVDRMAGKMALETERLKKLKVEAMETVRKLEPDLVDSPEHYPKIHATKAYDGDYQGIRFLMNNDLGEIHNKLVGDSPDRNDHIRLTDMLASRRMPNQQWLSQPYQPPSGPYHHHQAQESFLNRNGEFPRNGRQPFRAPANQFRPSREAPEVIAPGGDHRYPDSYYHPGGQYPYRDWPPYHHRPHHGQAWEEPEHHHGQGGYPHHDYHQQTGSRPRWPEDYSDEDRRRGSRGRQNGANSRQRARSADWSKNQRPDDRPGHLVEGESDPEIDIDMDNTSNDAGDISSSDISSAENKLKRGKHPQKQNYTSDFPRERRPSTGKVKHKSTHHRKAEISKHDEEEPLNKSKNNTRLKKSGPPPEVKAKHADLTKEKAGDPATNGRSVEDKAGSDTEDREAEDNEDESLIVDPKELCIDHEAESSEPDQNYIIGSEEDVGNLYSPESDSTPGGQEPVVKKPTELSKDKKPLPKADSPSSSSSRQVEPKAVDPVANAYQQMLMGGVKPKASHLPAPMVDDTSSDDIENELAAMPVAKAKTVGTFVSQGIHTRHAIDADPSDLSGSSLGPPGHPAASKNPPKRGGPAGDPQQQKKASDDGPGLLGSTFGGGRLGGGGLGGGRLGGGGLGGPPGMGHPVPLAFSTSSTGLTGGRLLHPAAQRQAAIAINSDDTDVGEIGAGKAGNKPKDGDVSGPDDQDDEDDFWN